MTDISNGQHWLDRNRAPRVQITYDVEIGDAIKKKELPLVVGILAGLGGTTKPALTLAERPFVDIDRDNFDKVMQEIGPAVTVAMPASKQPGKDVANGSFTAELAFTKLEDFEPLEIVKRVDALNTIYEIRTHLRDMLARLDGNVKLDQELSSSRRRASSPGLLNGTTTGTETGKVLTGAANGDVTPVAGTATGTETSAVSKDAANGGATPVTGTATGTETSAVSKDVANGGVTPVAGTATGTETSAVSKDAANGGLTPVAGGTPPTP